MKKFFENSDITVFERLKNSPNINPIENLWYVYKERLEEKVVVQQRSSFSLLQDCGFTIKRTKENWKKLVRSMANRINTIIKTKGCYITKW